MHFLTINEFFKLILLLVNWSVAHGLRHTIYWNSFMTPRLLDENGFSLKVKIGEFMDILCPQTSLMSITNGPHEPETFDIFNVTETDFHSCSPGIRSNFIFACDRPEQENKLTIKFQTISPSPLGFRFQYCQEYFFLATPRYKSKIDQGCHGYSSTRLRIKVACKDMPITSTATTTTTSTITTSSTKYFPPDMDFDVEKEEDLIKPEIIRPRPSVTKQDDHDDNMDVTALPLSGNGGGNSAGRITTSFAFVLFTTMINVLLLCLLTSPVT